MSSAAQDVLRFTSGLNEAYCRGSVEVPVWGYVLGKRNPEFSDRTTVYPKQ